MKKIITLVFMSAVLALTSCNDFLDKYPKYGVDPESEVTNEIAVALTTACCIRQVCGKRFLSPSEEYHAFVYTA